MIVSASPQSRSSSTAVSTPGQPSCASASLEDLARFQQNMLFGLRILYLCVQTRLHTPQQTRWAASSSDMFGNVLVLHLLQFAATGPSSAPVRTPCLWWLLSCLWRLTPHDCRDCLAPSVPATGLACTWHVAMWFIGAAATCLVAPSLACVQHWQQCTCSCPPCRPGMCTAWQHLAFGDNPSCPQSAKRHAAACA